MDLEFSINDKNPSASNVENESSDNPEALTSERETEGRITGRKRKAGTETVAAQNKRIKSAYNDGYRELLNSIIEDTVSFESIDRFGSFDPSQLGISNWSPFEKDVFFSWLDRLGRHDIRGIAAAIPSKSEPEVREYLRLLQHGSTEHYLHAPRQHLLGPTDIPAAFEISKACCDALDEAGRALESYQSDSDVRRERIRFDDYCVLDHKTALNLEIYVKDQDSADVSSKIDDGGTECNKPRSRKIPMDDLGFQKIWPSIRLLNLSKWLELSERVFMNPGAPRLDGNWASIAGSRKKPAMFASAFTDFHNLTVSVTKRLVHSTLFQTNSRLRATDFRANRYRSGALNVNRRDVLAALNVLGMNQNADNFWIGAPRRCGLAIYIVDTIEGRGSKNSLNMAGDPMNYGEVEKRLAEGYAQFKSRSNSQPVSGYDEENVDEVAALQDKYYDAHAEDSSTSYNDSTGSDTSSLADVSIGNTAPPASLPDTEDYHDPESEEDKHTKAFDEYASLLEERKLWAMLNRSPPTEIKPEDIILPKAPKPQRKEATDLVDWTDHVDYRSPWERYGVMIPAEAFVRALARKDAIAKPRKVTNLSSRAVRLTRGTVNDGQRSRDQGHNRGPSVVNDFPSDGPSERGDQISEDVHGTSQSSQDARHRVPSSSEDAPSDGSTDYEALDTDPYGDLQPESDEAEQPSPPAPSHPRTSRLTLPSLSFSDSNNASADHPSSDSSNASTDHPSSGNNSQHQPPPPPPLQSSAQPSAFPSQDQSSRSQRPTQPSSSTPIYASESVEGMTRIEDFLYYEDEM